MHKCQQFWDNEGKTTEDIVLKRQGVDDYDNEKRQSLDKYKN